MKPADAIFTTDESPPDRTGRDCDATGDAIKNRSWYPKKSFLDSFLVIEFITTKA